MHSGARSRRWLTILAVLIAADVVSSFETMMVYSALKRFNAEFGSPVKVAWLITAYMLASGAASVACGRLSDLFGRKRMLLILLASAAIGSAISAAHTSLNWIVAGRAIQGLAGAILPVCYALVREHMPEPRVPLASGFLMSAGAIGTILGLILGGLLVDIAPWQALFWTSGTMALVTLAAAWILIPADAPAIDRTGGLDLVGGLAFVPGVVAILFALTQLADWGIADPRMLALLGGAAVVIGGWAWHELRCPNPLIDLRLLGNSRIARPNLCMIMVAAGPLQLTMLMMLLIQQPVWTGIGLGLSAALAGGLKTPANITSILTSPLIGQLCRRFGSANIIVAGFALNSVAWSLPLLAGTSLPIVVTLILFSTVGTTAVFIAVANAIMLDAPPARAGEALGMMVLGRTLANAIGAQVATMLLTTSVVRMAGTPGTFPAPQAYRLVFTLMLAISCLGIAFSANMRRSEPGA